MKITETTQVERTFRIECDDDDLTFLKNVMRYVATCDEFHVTDHARAGALATQITNTLTLRRDHA